MKHTRDELSLRKRTFGSIIQTKIDFDSQTY
jgi:hypothetical protein